MTMAVSCVHLYSPGCQSGEMTDQGGSRQTCRQTTTPVPTLTCPPHYAYREKTEDFNPQAQRIADPPKIAI